jgi:hypothetical protein
MSISTLLHVQGSTKNVVSPISSRSTEDSRESELTFPVPFLASCSIISNQDISYPAPTPLVVNSPPQSDRSWSSQICVASEHMYTRRTYFCGCGPCTATKSPVHQHMRRRSVGSS